ncbi:MAG TPA: hypothetical protein VGI97_14765 [Gemmatimonadaceae bacterium]|jgi:hypothetical protein
MILDQQTVLWDAAALTTSAYSTNSFDCGAVGGGVSVYSANGDQPDPSAGEPMALGISVGVAATHAGTETYQFEVTQSASTTASSSPDTLVSVAFTTAQAATLLAAGKLIIIPIPPGSITKRYVSGHFTGANSSTITVTAWLAAVSWFRRHKYYATAVVIN